MKDFFVADASKFEGSSVTSYFVLSTLQTREKKTGGQFISVTLTDKTGTLQGVMWDDIADVLANCVEGCYVKVRGQVAKYQGKFQMTLQQMRFAAESEVDAGDYMPITRFDVEEMWAELRGYASAFANEDLKRLVFAFLDDPAIATAYKAAPAAKVLHHAWIGGLLEHVLTLVRVCNATAPF